MRDAPCPHCGCLLWFGPAPAPDPTAYRRAVAACRRTPIEEREPVPFGRAERIQWAVLAIVSSIIVWLNDQVLIASFVWLCGVILFGQFVLPPIFRGVDDYINEHDRFWLGVVCGWALVGLPVGVFFGVLVPYVHDCGVSSLVGGIGGLFAGPILAALEGLMIASVVNGIVWLATGKSLAESAT